MADESTEPVVGRLGVEVWRTAKATGINRKAAKSRCARQWGGWGRLSEDGPGHYNPDRSEDPWGRAAEATRTEVFQRAISPRHRAGHKMWRARSTKGGGKPDTAIIWFAGNGKAPPDTPALKPYWGKPAVRNFREDDGNVGIIRSPVRAIVLPGG